MEAITSISFFTETEILLRMETVVYNRQPKQKSSACMNHGTKGPCSGLARDKITRTCKPKKSDKTAEENIMESTQAKFPPLNYANQTSIMTVTG